MALRVWLPLNGNLNNQGLAPIGTFNASPAATVNDSGKIGKCYTFSGYTGYGVTFSGNSQLSTADFVNKYINHHSFSLCAWFKTSSSSTTRTPIIYITYGVYMFVGRTTFWGLRNSSDTVDCNAGMTTNDNVWHHIVGTYDCDTNKLSIYVDGVLKNTVNYTLGGTYASPWTNATYIGKNPNNTTQNDTYYFQGSLNDVRIYDHCLSPREVKEIARGLVLHYKLDDPYIEPTVNILSGKTDIATTSLWRRSGNSTIPTTDADNNVVLYGRKDGTTGTSQSYIANNNSGYVAISPNTTYTFSVDIKQSSTSANFYLYIYERTADGTASVKQTLVRFNPTTGEVGLWRRISTTITTQSTTGTFYLELNCVNGAVGDTVILKNNSIQWEAKDHATPYTPSSRSAFPVYDCSGYGNNGTPNGILTLSDDSPRYRKSTMFNGTNSYVTFGSQVSLANDHSICCWLDLTNVSAVQYFVAFTSGGGIRYSGGDNSFLYYAGGATYTWSYMKVNRFVHVAFVCASNSLSLYVDGQLIDSKTRTTSANCTGIGNRSTGYYYNGKISDFRIYSTALSADDVKELYNTSALIHNDGTIEAFEFVETESGSPEVTKTGLMKAQNIVEYPILCEWLQSDGNAVIDTGVPYDSTKDTYKIECKFCQPSNKGAYDAVFGAYTGENYKTLRCIRLNSDSNMGFYYNDKAGGGNPIVPGGANTNIKEIVFTSSSLVITQSGTTTTKTYGTKVSATDVNDINFFLFSTTATGNSYTKMYYFRIYDGDTLLRDMVPCIYNGVPGMWDKVESKFYKNNGTGSFIIGSIIDTGDVAKIYTNKTEASQLLES